MKIGIMQPYFFPYIGYFQLIHAVDTYVNLDHVSFIKRSYMTRNTVKNQVSISIPIKNASQHTSCLYTEVDLNEQYILKFKKTLHHLYSKSKFYNTIMDDIINPEFVVSPRTISDFNFSIIQRICNRIGIHTTVVSSSSKFNVEHLKNQHMIKEIVLKLNGNHYINAIGGQTLYDKEFFEQDKININFIKMENVEFENPYSSILDILFRYDPEHINKQLNRYTFI